MKSGSARRYTTRLVQALPSPVRAAVWDTRRALARRARRIRESRGDFSRSHPASHEMDLYLDRVFSGTRDGFFVEAGALDGFYESNTYYLERARSWRGLLIEPTPRFARNARRERPGSQVVECALVAPDFPDDHVELRFGGSKTVVNADGAEAWVADAQSEIALDDPEHVYKAPAKTLSSILDDLGSPEIDLLSLDVEGYEPRVLEGLDLVRHAPRYVLVEVDMRAPRRLVEDALDGLYRVHTELSPHDVLYERVS